jgi:Ca2+-binding RTX toxin-like protein
METDMGSSLASLIAALKADPGLKSSISAADIKAGTDAAIFLNTTLLAVIAAQTLNADNRIDAADMQAVSDYLHLRANAAEYVDFLNGHGNDNGTVESGFHYLQNDGGTLLFQGRDFVDTVADAIYHYGFGIQNGRYFNEDGNNNELVDDVAGWLNYFLNGENIVYGTGGDDQLGSGEYSEYFADARNETFLAGDGNDRVWADVGHDTVDLGNGNDVSGGGDGNDTLMGRKGNDSLYGEQGQDSLAGGSGMDRLGGGDGNDALDGEAGADVLYGEMGNDGLLGGSQNDTLHGQDGADVLDGGTEDDLLYGGIGSDRLKGDLGNDTLHGGDNGDIITGGAGADTALLWENGKSRDTLIFRVGDSGRSFGTMDRVEGFQTGIDKINLAALGVTVFEALDYTGGQTKSCYYDGKYLRIDHTGDGVTDMMVEFAWTATLAAGDFILA